MITDAIRDENVLKFSVEYVGRYKEKEDSQNFVDIEVENIDVNELYESEDRLDKITDYIIHHHNSKTHNRAFTGMFCVSNVKTLIRYYDLFKKKYDNGEHDLKIATIFSYAPNEEDLGATGSFIDGEIEPEDLPKHSRDRLEDFIEDYNKMFGTKYSTKDGQSYYNYYNNISKKVKNKEIDVLLVVNMFLTGFDSQALNTLYVDKNLKYHGLIQSYSRTNRILNERKSQGNIVVFRNLKKRTDDAISLFSNKDAIEEVLMKPYQAYLAEFNEALKALKEITPTIDSVNSLQSEEEDVQFITAFRDLIRIRNILLTFADFKFEDTDIQHQEYEDFKSKYLDVYEKYKSEVATKTSIIDDVDFELDLIRRDEINVTYIFNLLEALKSDLTIDGQANKRKQIMDILSGDRKLRSKRELIEKFIDDHLSGLKENDDINEAFDEYWNEEKEKHFIELCNDEEIDPEELHKIVGNHIYSNQKIQRDDVINALKEKPKLLDRKPIATRIIDKVYSYIEIFMNGME